MIVLIFFLTIAGFFTLYLSFLTVAGFFYKSSYKRISVLLKFNRELKQHRFAIIVPAHNEERVIEKTVRNLVNLDYPKELFDVIVVADNCNDKTSICASKAGAIVLERENRNLKGKGYVLKFCFGLFTRLQKQFDAFFVVDADTIASKDILKILNIYLNYESEAIQCADLVKPNPGAWSSEITRVGLYLYNYAKPLGRKVLGLTAGLRGNGMCFTTALLKRIPWQAYSQTEDLEYGMILLLNGINVTFAPEAKVYAVMPANPQNAVSQRARWEFGRFPLIKKYAGILFKEAIIKRSFKIFDSLIELLTPAFVNLFLVTALMLVLTFILTMTNFISSPVLLLLWTIIFGLQIFYVLGGLYLSKADSNAYKALWNVPKFALWKIILYLKLLVKGHTKLWVRTVRE